MRTRFTRANRGDELDHTTRPGRAAPDGPEAARQGAETVWHVLPVTAVLERLGTPVTGLASGAASERLTRHGPNELQALGRVSAWSTLLAQFKNVLIVILLAATLVSGMLGHTLEAVVIAVIVFLAVALGFVQEYRAERALEALRKMAAPTAHVLRDGREVMVAARELVPGDIVVLRAGDRVPADVRVIQAANLSVDEAALTGESIPVDKMPDALPDARLALGDRRNMAFAGTLVTYGRGQAVVTATGMATEFGRISTLVQSVEAGHTPLQENLDRLGRALGKAALLVVVLIVVLGIWRGLPPLEMLIFGIALAVAVVPEALPAVVTISLAIGVRRMVRRNALVRRLPVVETLGSTSVICSDKTGTLTRGEMTVRRVFGDGRWFDVTGAGYAPSGEFRLDDRPVAPPPVLMELLRAGVLVSDATLVQSDGQWLVSGDPTEGALVAMAAKAGLDRAALETACPRLAEIPFSSERKRMTTLHATPDGPVAYTKGAAELVANRCSRYLRADGDSLLTDADRDGIRAAEQLLAAQGLRVLAVARKSTSDLEGADDGMTFLGLIAMMDPPRPEAKAAIETCRSAGIRPVMITGDHPITARAVAHELTLLDGGRLVTGQELEAMTDAELAGAVDGISVYARVSPAHKLRVVEAWQEGGQVVAMTGDGVNDAPALKKADVGVAMGVSGTDVSKEAAAMTLLDDNFASIVAAIEEGRIVFNNIKKYLTYLLSSNVGEVLLMALATLGGLPLPLTAVQILYVNLATDGLPALALAVDPPERDLMRRNPRDPRAGVFTRPVVILLLAGGVWSGFANLGLFVWLLQTGRSIESAMAMTFMSLVFIQFFKAYNYRSDRLSVFQRPFANRWLNLAVVWELAMLVAVVYVPLLQRAFGTFALSAAEWALVAGVALSVVPVLELVKWCLRSSDEGGSDRT